MLIERQFLPPSVLLNRPPNANWPLGAGYGDQVASVAAKRVVGVRGSMAKILTLRKVNPVLPAVLQCAPPSMLLNTLPDAPDEEAAAPT